LADVRSDMHNNAARKIIAILTPVYNEEMNLQLYEKAVREILFTNGSYDFKVLFIDDGSSDGSWRKITEICSRDARFKGIRLSRNYGSHIALSAGFAHLKADAVCILACDLQDPPEILLEFIEKWEKGAKIVWGKRRTRRDGFFRKAASGLFFRLIRRYAMPRGSMFTTGSFLLVDRTVAECLRLFGEQNRITFALVAWTGFDQEVVVYDRRQRVAGQSGWTFSKMLKTMYDAFFGFSFVPIRIMTIIGVSVFFFSIIFAAYLVVCWYVRHPVPGYTSNMVVITFFFGIQFLLMGLVGEYLYRIYSEVVRRPLYFISEKTETGNSYESDRE